VLRVWEIPGLITSQGPHHTKDVIKWYEDRPNANIGANEHD